MLLVCSWIDAQTEGKDDMGLGHAFLQHPRCIMVPRQEAEMLRSVLDDPRKCETLCSHGPLVAWGALFLLLLAGSVFAL